ncbi:MAG: hypothetical protein JKY59_09045 [Emcibacter sp.]|nr:hypothetical protein [Emcibacter sp.]
MDKIYTLALDVMGQSFEILSKKISPPCKVSMSNGYDYRYKEKSIEQAIIQKLARLVTGLQAITSLNKTGFYQEQAALQRMLDEFEEDITFLCFAIIFNDFTDHHQKYLDYFYEEEFDVPENSIASKQKRGMVSRQKIRAFIYKDRRQSSSIEVSRTISKNYSGFLHGASPQIMELYFGNPPKFQLWNTINSPFRADHMDDLFNYYYRAIFSFYFSANAFGDDKLCDKIIKFSDEFTITSDRK